MSKKKFTPIFPPDLVLTKTTPECPLFGQCGGCQYQDLVYADELVVKEYYLREILLAGLVLPEHVFAPIVPSPKQYNYRSRMDLKFLKTRQKKYFMGFSPVPGQGFLLEAEACPIALEAISEFLPELKNLAIAKLPDKYRLANLVVKSGDDGRIFWGGIGRRSLRMAEADYLWTEIQGRKIFYSLDTFFQANLSILPSVMKTVISLNVLDKDTIFYDLYGGVGLFGICLHDSVSQVLLIEENIYATHMAEYNASQNGLKGIEIISGRMEDFILECVSRPATQKRVALIDPPRAGLSAAVSDALAFARFDHLLYLSCNPQSLVRDLALLTAQSWQVDKIIPIDFFPRTRHLETLVVLQPR